MKLFFKSLFILNIVSFLLSILYLVFPIETVYLNGYGLLLIVTLTGNIISSVIGSQSKKADFAYLILSSVGLTAVLLLNTVASLSPTNASSRSILSIGILILMMILGAIVTRTPRTKRSARGTFLSQRQSEKKTKKVIRIILMFLLTAFLLIGAFLAFVLVTGRDVGLVQVVISQYSLFYSLIFLSIAGLLLKISKFRLRSIIGVLISILGISLFVLFNLPLFTLPSLLNETKTDYTEAFGEEWKTIGEDNSLFMSSPISIPGYFFGISSTDHTVTEDVLFYEGTEGVDEGLELRFDVYTPPVNADQLPGQGSTLIRIHGGGWNSGNKGSENYSQINKYFADQGYVVFDVQYGLNDQDQFVEFATVPDEISGDFSIDDMVRHLGIFTTYLADHHEEYSANIDSVFVSGGSAGGHLANAVALGLSSGEYTDLLDDRLTVNGIIPIYPANGLAGYQDITGEDELVDPALLVEENSPPALVYQGQHDTIVDPRVAENFKDAYLENNNTEIAIIRMPYGEHASDLYFPGFYSQTFIYYMERFMYQYR
ncbi:Possible esterase/lipase [Marinilactibacillus psychrotolerans 42ea]|uniref:Possible esterase/lipase n=1 Tax=Marinilactibacillus psychrotolerans 42ea TaxID=1255609 RepID=A0A1R4IT16_9LACT|nr:alpha/beta hydrolase fold domain-containing protein [Marinilactibacillus psychrotolerans]SJN22854.1 Possible esterase/lipase [Marinilactibacillus psychrotolerans 42ea]